MKVNINKLKLLPNLISDNSILKSHSTSSFQSNCFKETITIEPKNFRGWGSKFSFPEFLDKYVDKVNDYVELVTIKSEFKPEILPKFIGRVNTLDVSNSVKPYGTLAISSTLDKYLSTSGLKVCAGASIVDRSHNLQTILHCCPTVGENESLIKYILSHSNPKDLEITIVPGANIETDTTLDFLVECIKKYAPQAKIKFANFPDMDSSTLILHNGILKCGTYENVIPKINPLDRIIFG